MPKNIELKTKLENFDRIKLILKQRGIELSEILIQTDIYYDFSNFLLKLRKSNEEYQLIKYNRDEYGKERISDYEILKIRGEDPISFFNSIFKISTIVKKKRELYLYKNTRIHLDEVETLGKFLEIETVVKSSDEEAQTEFQQVVNLLELDLSKQLKVSYRDLLISMNRM